MPPAVSSPRVQDIRQATPSHVQGNISRRQYVALWTFMVSLHALCSAFLLACAKLHWLMENEYLDYFATLLAPAHDRHFRVVGTVLGVLGAAHALQLLSHLGASIVARKLTVRSMNLGSDSLSLMSLVLHVLARLRTWVKHRWRSSRSVQQRQHLSRSTTSTRPTSASSSERYARMFAVRKTVEIATQVPNGYLYSTLIARSWINHAKVALLVANCWSAFVIHQMLMENEPARSRVGPSRATPSRRVVRFLAVVVDALLATATGVLLPSVIFFPYLLEFDIENLSFPDSLLYGDTEFPNLVLENRAFFAISWANAVMKGVPHVSAFLCLLAIASMLDAASNTNPVPPVARLSQSPPRIGRNTKRSSLATVSYRVLMNATNAVQRPVRLVQRVHRVAAPLLFLATGAIVLALHLAARYGHVDGDVDAMKTVCLQRMYPWLTGNFSCAVVKYNCYREGVATPLADTLAWLEREAVRNIIFMNCPAFVMPSIIRELPFLMGIELWNSTLVSWGEEAALSARLHPTMLFLIFAYVNMSGIPQGILQHPLPIQLTDIELSHTNLTILPDEIAESWTRVELVYIEHSELNPFPTVLLQLPLLGELSLIDNQFESMPTDSLLTAASTYFYDLALSRNPLQNLPEARSEGFDVSYLALEYTQLTQLPAWASNQVGDAVSLGGSPVCSVEVPELALCGQDDETWDPLGDERYPTGLIKPSRSLDG